MGDRANFGFKADGDNVINLYGHWAGAYRYQLVAQALEASRSRWQDNGYATRIAISTWNLLKRQKYHFSFLGVHLIYVQPTTHFV